MWDPHASDHLGLNIASCPFQCSSDGCLSPLPQQVLDFRPFQIPAPTSSKLPVQLTSHHDSDLRHLVLSPISSFVSISVSISSLVFISVSVHFEVLSVVLSSSLTLLVDIESTVLPSSSVPWLLMISPSYFFSGSTPVMDVMVSIFIDEIDNSFHSISASLRVKDTSLGFHVRLATSKRDSQAQSPPATCERDSCWHHLLQQVLCPWSRIHVSNRCFVFSSTSCVDLFFRGCYLLFVIFSSSTLIQVFDVSIMSLQGGVKEYFYN